MRQAQKTNTESTPTSLQRKGEKNTEHSNKLAEFADNRASIVSQRKLSETIGQKRPMKVEIRQLLRKHQKHTKM